ncbi:MAG: hypothetical protein U9R08_04165 [Nanoarchaeota archaeon]|nr:hypothetical protein [Nanoarchaeota archaeon]
MRKTYGSYRTDNCPFCGARAVTKNSQGVPVCVDHKNKNLNDLKCACGSWLDVKTGKFGVYFNCINCGNINFRKAMEMNEKVKVQSKKERKEIVVNSDRVDFLY